MSLSSQPRAERRPPDGGSTALTTEDAFEALANRRRRYVVHWLLEVDRRTDIRQLSRQVAAWENEKSRESVTPQERRRVYNALQQFHLPKLDDIGVIDYDDRGVVEASEALSTLEGYMDRSRLPTWCSRPLLLGGALVGVTTLLVAAGSFAPLLAMILGILIGVVIGGSLGARRDPVGPIRLDGTRQ